MNGLAMFLALSAAPVAISEPPPRPLREAAIRMAVPISHVSSVRELPDGRVVMTNPKEPVVLVLDLEKGTSARVGEAGGGVDRYARPGGLYAGPDGTTLLLDRAQTRVFTISAKGELQGSRSVARRGVTSYSDADLDLQRLDSRGYTYFVDREARLPGGPGPQTMSLVRFQPETQALQEIARLRKRESRIISAKDGLVVSREIVGSSADAWGVAPDGRVAVIRADPYRVEWHSPDGRIVRGPIIEFTRLPMTDADRRHFAAAQRGSVSAGQAGDRKADAAATEMLFAESKPAFYPDDVVVSPDVRAWVMRTRPLGAHDAVYDVFDAAGRRVDRIQLPAGSQIVGFGTAAVYVRRFDENGRCELKKYGLK